MSRIATLLRSLPAAAVRVSHLTAPRADGGHLTTVECTGCPDAFRALAGVLLEMANRVEGQADGGWHVALSPDDFGALVLVGADNLSLNCLAPAGRRSGPPTAEPV